jgi:hypothetical protein
MLPPQGGRMTKTKLMVIVSALSVCFAFAGYSSVNAVDNDQKVYAKSKSWPSMPQPIATVTAPKESAVKKLDCKDDLVLFLHDIGFEGNNLRQAWAIAMRESTGNERSISKTGDYGLFQFNYAAHNQQDWWDSSKLLEREYNARVAYKVSRGGRTWYPWDIDGQGNHMGRYSPKFVYDVYLKWYNKYPC